MAVAVHEVENPGGTLVEVVVDEDHVCCRHLAACVNACDTIAHMQIGQSSRHKMPIVIEREHLTLPSKAAARIFKLGRLFFANNGVGNRI